MPTQREKEAEDVQKRRIARLRFKKIVRMVMYNRDWLVDSTDQKFSLNVKKNIAMLVREDRKIGMLTLSEKTILRKRHALRTIEERKKLVTLLSGLSCFAGLPPKVRARLAPVVNFMYIPSGRTVIRKGHIPNDIYFVLTGEIDVNYKEYDHFSKTIVTKTEYVCGPGGILGEVAIIEHNRRNFTCVTQTDCEVLVLYREDFDRILRTVMTKNWNNKKNSILALGYFAFLNARQIVRLTNAAILRQFEPLETIYYEDKGFTSYVHFVVSGECMILQCLRMKVTTKNGRKTFKLVDISKEDGNAMFQNLGNNTENTQTKSVDGENEQDDFIYNIDALIASDNDEQDDKKTKKTPTRKLDVASIMRSCGIESDSEKDKQTNKSKSNGKSNYEMEINKNDLKLNAIDNELNAMLTEDSKVNESENLPTEDTVQNSEYISSEYGEEFVSLENVSNISDDEEEAEEEEDQTDDSNAPRITTLTFGFEGTDTLEYTLEKRRKKKGRRGGFRAQEERSNQAKTTIENRFIDVGSMTFGGIFGLGEKLEHRVIMARTTVQCLMIPRFCLFEPDRNPGNVWQRRRWYLESIIPSRQSLFEDFLTTRKWSKYKNDLVESCLDPNSRSNPTKVQDIPIISRIVEANDE